jgi:hypothetical protein
MIDKNRLIATYSELRHIPHLNLTAYLPQVPLKNMLTELLQFEDLDFQPYENGLIRKEYLEIMQKSWHGLCLIENCREGKHHIDYKTTEDHNLTFHEPGQYLPTDIGLVMPNTISYLYSIAKAPERTRLLKLKSKGNASWHSHFILAKSGLSQIDDQLFVNPVIQIPLITNSYVEMIVSKTDPKTETTPKLYKQKYQAGEVWIFNSYYYHNVYNNGQYDRDHIMMYASLDDEILFPIIEKAVKEYKNDRIF